jgi:hypothetical protein
MWSTFIKRGKGNAFHLTPAIIAMAGHCGKVWGRKWIARDKRRPGQSVL